MNEKLKGIKGALKEWSKQHGEDFDGRIVEANKEVDDIDKLGELQDLVDKQHNRR